MRRREHQSGFGTVEILLFVLVVAVLAVVGIVVPQRHKPISAQFSAATSQKQTTTQPQSSATTQPAPTATQYLTIKEWGIKIPLTDSIKGAYYTMSGSNIGTDGLPNTAWLGLPSLNSSGCNIANTGPSPTAKPVGSILRVRPTDTDPVSGTLYTQLYPNGTTINGYYYAYAPWKNSTCASSTALQSFNSAFSTAANSTVSATTTN